MVQEYTSNVNIRNWVTANFAFGDYFLNYNAVLIITVLLEALLS
jgi:hypothetical protein